MTAVLAVIGIFLLRVVNNAIGTMRVIVTANGQRTLALVLAFVESLIFAFAAGVVLTDLSNIPNLIAYAAGFAVGGYVGILIEERLVVGYVTVNVISMAHGHEIAEKLRKEGFGVTESIGEGSSGSVTMLMSVILRQDATKLTKIIQQVDTKAFITVEAARSLQHGWVRTARTNFR